MQLLELVDRTRVHNGRRVGLRDALVLALLADGLNRREIRALNAKDLVQHDASGVFYAQVVQRGRKVLLRLRPNTSAIALDYLEAERCYGEDRPLFVAGRRMRSRLCAAAVRNIPRQYARKAGR